MTHLAFCGPVSLQLLSSEVELTCSLPVGYACPLMSYLIRALLRKNIRVTVVTSCRGRADPRLARRKNNGSRDPEALAGALLFGWLPA